jgi:hypothetical protein
MRTKLITGISCLAFLFACSETEEEIFVVINEFMVRNTNTSQFADCLGNHEDWVELYNTGDKEILMSKIYISDRSNNLLKKRLHDTIIPPGGYYLLWGGDFTCEHNNHLGFAFDATDTTKNEQIVISDGKGNIIDSFSHMEVPEAREPNRSYGRFPDGSESWGQQVTPTPGLPNEG